MFSPALYRAGPVSPFDSLMFAVGTSLLDFIESRLFPEPEAAPPVKTGCTLGNATYQPGDEFFDGCEFKCMCNSEEEIECKVRHR